MFRTSYSFVAQSRAAVPDQLARLCDQLARLWYGQYNPASCSYTPLYVASESLPKAYTRYVVCVRVCGVCMCVCVCVCVCVCAFVVPHAAVFMIPPVFK